MILYALFKAKLIKLIYITKQSMYICHSIANYYDYFTPKTRFSLYLCTQITNYYTHI